MTTEQVWDEFGAKLKAFIRARVKNDQQAEDLLQDVFLKIHLKLNDLKEEQKLVSWLYQITRNAITDFYREKKIDPGLYRAEYESEIGAEEFVFHEDFILCILPFLLQLPDRDQEALYRTKFGTSSQKEYALEIGEPYSTVKSRIQRAKKKLKQQFNACCGVEFDRYGNVVSSHFENCSCEIASSCE